MTSVWSGMIALVLTAVIGWFLVPALRALKAGQSIKEIGPSWHMSKQGTPTMGGIMFMAAITICVLAFGWKDLAAGDFSALFVLVFALVYGAIGFVDDYAKVKKHENTGLTAGWKFLLQLAAAVAFLALLRSTHHLSANLYIPFINTYLTLPWPVYMVFAAFIIVGCVNSVNLTDGVDGLAASVTLPVAVFFAVLSAWWEKGALGVFAGALAGSLVGFLLYNFHPAKVFMGDTGSLFLGARCAAWPLPWTRLWCSCRWASSISPRPSATSFRWSTLSSPMASVSSVWPPYTTTWSWAAGARCASC